MPSALLSCALLLAPACGGGNSLTGTNEPAATPGARPATHFQPGFNLFSPEQDVQLGSQSAQQMARQLPLMQDAQTVAYVRDLGSRLAAGAPGERFPYQFNVVGTREMNAFALPGGFIFVNAGAIMQARNEGELAGVIAHEIMHVALRHGTNQASKAYIAQAGLGALGRLTSAGGVPELGQVIGAVGGAGANMLFLKFGRTAERQADLDGARLMAAAGYDPRDMASFFQTLERQGGQRTPEFLSDHPDPGNRVRAITELLPQITVNRNAQRGSASFDQIKARLTGSRTNMRADVDLNRTGPRDPNRIPGGARPAAPSAQSATFRAPDNSYSLECPANWGQASGGDATNIILAPQGGAGVRGQTTFVTHGAFVGTLQTNERDLANATRLLLEQQLAANPDFRIAQSPQAVTVGGRPGFLTVVTGPSTVSSVQEVDAVFTAFAPDGRLFYLIAIAPEDELRNYERAFERMSASVRFGG